MAVKTSKSPTAQVKLCTLRLLSHAVYVAS